MLNDREFANTTVLDKTSEIQVYTDPYPYLVVRNALPTKFYEELSATYPTLDGVAPAHANANNKRLDLLSSWGKALLPNELVSSAWRQFMNSHTTSEFSRRVFDCFPSVVERTGSGRRINVDAYGQGLSDTLKIGKTIAEEEVVGRVTLGVNTPVTAVTSVRGAHVDSPRKAYVGLFYVRHPDDRSEGGDLAVYRWKHGAVAEPWAQKTELDNVEEVAVIPYEPNTFVLMLSTSRALHGVTPRQPTPYIRRLAIVSGWFPGVDQSNFARGNLANMTESLKAVTAS